MKHMLRAVFLVMLLCFLSGKACGELLAVDSLRSSVVHIYGIGYDDTGSLKSRWTGSGFAVGAAGEDSCVFLTNRHVALGNGSYDAKNVKIWLLLDDARFYPNREPMPGWAVECEVLAVSQDADVAVIRTCRPVSGHPALALMSSRRVRNRTAVYALGFGGMAVTRSGRDSGAQDVQISCGAVEKSVVLTQAEDSKALVHTAKMAPGNSGGPLVDERGAVVGINAYGFSVSSDYFCSLYIDYGMALLDALGIAYTVSDGPGILAVWIANFQLSGKAVCGMLLALAVGAMIRRKQRKCCL